MKETMDYKTMGAHFFVTSSQMPSSDWRTVQALARIPSILDTAEVRQN